jgi:DNA repair protein RadC
MKSLSFETTIKYKRKKPSEIPGFGAPSEIVAFLKPYFEENMQYSEVMFALFLDSANQPICVTKLGEGTLSACLVNTAKLYQTAILSNCKSVVIAHNHPSGNLKASEADRQLSDKVKEGLKLLDMDLLDSLIITKDSFVTVL